MTTDTLQAIHIPAGINAHHAPTLNVLGMAVGVKIAHSQTSGQFSAVECHLLPRQMGPPPHVHYALDEIMYVTQGTVSLLEGDRVVEVGAGGWHLRPRGVLHTFWNGTDAPAAFLDLYPGDQDFAHYLEELAPARGRPARGGCQPDGPRKPGPLQSPGCPLRPRGFLRADAGPPGQIRPPGGLNRSASAQPGGRPCSLG